MNFRGFTVVIVAIWVVLRVLPSNWFVHRAYNAFFMKSRNHMRRKLKFRSKGTETPADQSDMDLVVKKEERYYSLSRFEATTHLRWISNYLNIPFFLFHFESHPPCFSPCSRRSYRPRVPHIAKVVTRVATLISKRSQP